MEILSNLIQNIVLTPNAVTVLSLFATSLINELFGIVPYTILLSGQMVFLKTFLSMDIVVKLFVFVAVPVGIGTAIGSLLIYELAYWGGKPAIEKFGRKVRLSWESVEKVQSKFRGSWYDEVLFLVLRTVPFMPGLPISAAAGILRMRVSNFFLITAIGSTIKIMIMCILVGFGTQVVA